jgi:hypothetical protein
LGLNIVVEPAASNEHEALRPINIIFVHGLGGSSRGTWTHQESGKFWPEWLPNIKGLEHARIMTFGYDADWTKVWTPNSVLDISNFGDQLLNDVFLHYESFGEVTFQYYLPSTY